MTVDRYKPLSDASSDVSSLVGRLDALERENRRWKRGVLLAATAFAAAAILGMAPPPTRTLDLEVLRIVDARGKARAVLAMGDEGPALSFFDEKGRLRANLGVAKEGPSLDLLDTAESPRAQLTVDGKQDPHLDFIDGKGVSVSLRP
ncbi:MAG TPA: hypothetical protein VFS09_07775 [Candidatus Eisenbacteria bacterium]|nr:hypothetical protein [Candidatus Eisenbacteria bacterium]